ncbi:hypothetical protein CAEBREN_13289 [Caenorhabditis brenneri]|uniref:Uncharacterized protein n=1 Tax=Caenorhabditis brenneri TaxID=135651 RepID=G0P414_CAEBE|nr:hypothetical protein CAEBREN_13289 [Caenorhabditis brenneri]
MSEFTVVTVETQAMTSLEVASAVDQISKMIEMVKKVLEKGKSFYDFFYIEGVINAGKGIGDILSGKHKFDPKKEEAVFNELKILETGIKKLGDQMANGFNELKAYLSEFKFFLSIISPVSVLTKHMRNCLKHPGPDATQNFSKAYSEHSPMALIMTLISYLEGGSSNPIRVAMASGEDRKLDPILAFKKWENIIKGVLGQFLLLEAFANGLLEFESDFNCTQLVKESTGILDTLKKINLECEDINYWEDLKAFMNEYTPSHTHLNNFQKVNELKAKLEGYRTCDAFFVVVFNEGNFDETYSYVCPNADDQLIGVWNKGMCNAFVYRSREANFMPESEFVDVKNAGRVAGYGKLFGGYKDRIQKQLIDTTAIRSDGLVWLGDMWRDVAVETANCRGREKGPGWFNDVQIDKYPSHKIEVMIIAFP